MRPFASALALALLVPSIAAAQFAGTADSISDTPFTVSVSPFYPQPYSTVVLSFLSGSLDLANATLSVSVAGKRVYQGSVQPVSISLGAGGVVTTATVTISVNGKNYMQSVSMVPQEVSLVIEPLASAPPLYPGKPEIPLEGDVRIVAVAALRAPGGKVIDPALLSYTWTVDGVRIAQSSGIGKSAIIVASPLQYRSRDVSVRVSSQDGSVAGGSALSFSPTEPTLLVYESDPLLGVRFERALGGSYRLSGAESSFYAAPFSLPTTGGTPLVRWFLTGELAQVGNTITLRPTGSGVGNASLSLSASSGGYTAATANLSVLFGSSGTNFFGL